MHTGGSDSILSKRGKKEGRKEGRMDLGLIFKLHMYTPCN